MSTFCCTTCPLEPTCSDLLDATFARPDDITESS